MNDLDNNIYFLLLENKLEFKIPRRKNIYIYINIRHIPIGV